jgi:acetyl esterase/lipase
MQLVKMFSRSPIFLLLQAIILCVISAAAIAQQTPSSAANAQSASAPAQNTQSAPPQAQDGLPKPSLPPAIDFKTGTPLYEEIQEDWSSLSIGASKLEPEPPLVAVHDEQLNFTKYLVQVKWRPGDPIDLWIILPKNVQKPPVVLYLYGVNQDTDRFRDDRWDARVTNGGVAAVGFVSALTGQRFHDRPMKQWFVSELQEALGSTVHDVKFILDYLAQRGDVDMNRVGMFGEGSGGSIAILAAAADPRIKVVDTLEPWGDWPDFLAKSDLVAKDPNHAEYVKPEFLKKVAPLDPVKWLPQLKIPIRIQQVHQSAALPIECKDAIKAVAPKQAEVVRLEAISDLSSREGGGILFEWIKKQLRNGAKPPEGTMSADKSAVPGATGSQASQR